MVRIQIKSVAHNRYNNDLFNCYIWCVCILCVIDLTHNKIFVARVIGVLLFRSWLSVLIYRWNFIFCLFRWCQSSRLRIIWRKNDTKCNEYIECSCQCQCPWNRSSASEQLLNKVPSFTIKNYFIIIINVNEVKMWEMKEKWIINLNLMKKSHEWIYV